MGLSSLRQGATKVSDFSKNSGKGGKGGMFNKLIAPKLSPQLQGMLRPNEQPGAAIMLVKPEQLYDDVYDIDDHGNSKGTKGEGLHFIAHEFKYVKNGKEQFKKVVCSAGPNPHAPQPCVGCTQVDAGNKAVGNARQGWAFDIKHLAPYHEVPLVDRNTNQVKMRKDRPNEPVMVLQACQMGTPSERLYHQGKGKTNCEYCQRNLPLVVGGPKVLEVGKNQLDELIRVNDHIEQTCMACMTRVIKTAFVCNQCGEDLLDLAVCQLVNDQIKQFADTPQQCQKCGFAGKPKAAYDCGWDPSGMYKVPNGCPQNQEPRPMSLFDCVFYVHREGEGTQTKLVVSPPIPLSQFRTATGKADLAEWLQTPHLRRTFDLRDMYMPLSTDEQASTYGIPNPYAQQQSPQYQQYPGQPQQTFQAPQYGSPQQAPAPQAPPYGTPQPGFPPQQPQYQQYNAPQQQPPGAGTQQPTPQVPFSGRPDFRK